MIELLAPAGNMECLKAAILNGADAIYMGLEDFNARKRADNFTRDNFLEAVNFCHVRDKKIYLALNILINTNEMNEALDVALFAYNNGVDGIIVQDLGLAYNIKKQIPNVKLHASTQCTVINKEGVKNLTKLSFDRIVVGRELTIEQLNEVCKLNVDIEVFIHGALCVSYSGQCLMSSLNGGRSGNRGLCAQPCRLKYDVYEGNNKIASNNILSPKDVCTIEKIEEIIKSGVKSLKIEGRMKSPQYVAQVVKSYRKAIDGVYDKADYEKMAQLFNREGFFKSYLFEKPGKKIFAYNKATNSGIKIGKVISVNEVKDTISIATNKEVESGDGISFDDTNKGMYVRLIKKEEDKIIIIASGLLPKEHTDVYMTYDKSLDKELLKSYNDDNKVKSDIQINAYFKIGEFPRLEYNDISVVGDTKCEKANNPMKDRIISQIQKTGNTIFNITNINEIVFENIYYPISKINELRRQLINKIYESKLVKVNNHKISNILLPVKENKYKKKVSVFFYKYNSNIDYSKIDADIIYLPIEAKNKLSNNKVEYWVEENNTSYNNSLVANVGLLKKENRLDHGMNIYNPWTVLALEKISNIKSATLSIELNETQLNNLYNKINYPVEVVVYGKSVVMKSKYCINGALYNKSECSKKNIHIDNRDNNVYEVIPYCNTCTSYILNNDVIDYTDKNINADIYRINIHNENLNEINEIIKKVYRELIDKD